MVRVEIFRIILFPILFHSTLQVPSSTLFSCHSIYSSFRKFCHQCFGKIYLHTTLGLNKHFGSRRVWFVANCFLVFWIWDQIKTDWVSDNWRQSWLLNVHPLIPSMSSGFVYDVLGNESRQHWLDFMPFIPTKTSIKATFQQRLFPPQPPYNTAQYIN